MDKIISGYQRWLKTLKANFRSVQQKASISVNQQLLLFYWELGKEIVDRQENHKWGSGFLTHLSKDLSNEFKDVKGFSKRNLQFMRKWYLFWNNSNFAKQAVSQLSDTPQTKDSVLDMITNVPWGHNILITSKCKTIEEAIFYVSEIIQNGWSRDVLRHQIESQLYQREGKAITNFKTTLPKFQSDLAQQTLKDPYIFDFLAMTKDYSERDLENQLTEHITQFLLELGTGFAFIGRQVALNVSNRNFFIDLLFYHTKLHCYIVLELKTGQFEPEYAGKLNFYIKAVDEQLKTEKDESTIGLLLCKEKDKLIAEYALSDIHKPMGISEYHLTQMLPNDLRSSLPSIKQIEKELSDDDS